MTEEAVTNLEQLTAVRSELRTACIRASACADDVVLGRRVRWLRGLLIHWYWEFRVRAWARGGPTRLDYAVLRWLSRAIDAVDGVTGGRSPASLTRPRLNLISVGWQYVKLPCQPSSCTSIVDIPNGGTSAVPPFLMHL